MDVRSPQHLTSHIDITDWVDSSGEPDNHMSGALVSIDLMCPADLFRGRKNLVAKFSLFFSTQIQNEAHRPIAIQHAEVHYFSADNDIVEQLKLLRCHKPEIKKEEFKDGKADIEIPKSNTYENKDSSNVRIVVLLNAYPSNLDVFTSMASLSPADGYNRPSHAFTSVAYPQPTPFPSERRLQRLLCWTATLGYESLFAAYLDQEPSILDMEDEFGMTPFSCAAFAGQTSVILRVLHQGGSSSARNKTTQGPSPLEAAALKGDAQIFFSFLKYLKYFEALRGEIPELDKIPPLDRMPPLEESDIECEFKTAVLSGQTAIIQKLVQIRLEKETEKKEWLARQMVQAADIGVLSLVQILMSYGAEVDTEANVLVNGEVSHKTTPLMSAIEANRAKVAEFLIIHGAGNEDALQVAVRKKQHSIIRALLQAGILVKEDFKKDLLNVATALNDSTTFMLLESEKGTGKLATSADLDPIVDEHFEATVITFHEEKPPYFEELSVAKLMLKSNNFFSLDNELNKFRWFHLPANNMKWVEALFGKIYHENPSLAYNVLEPKRWVERQHEGERGSPHARFMMPACHDFSEAFQDKKKFRSLKKDKHVVLFMPFLHWDEEDAMQNRSNYLLEAFSGEKISYPRVWAGISDPPGRIEKEKMLLGKYLLSEGDVDPNFRHVLHIRRTLDQYLYYDLKDRIVRDADHTVHRYQKKLNKNRHPYNKDPLTAIMVDQLWLWILVDQSGKAKAIVTCFPSRDWSDIAKSVLDRRRTTDIFQSMRSYIQQWPDTVKTPYDLAEVIATRCSRALLDLPHDMLNYAEIYENSISDIAIENTMQLNRFNNLLQTRTMIMDQFGEMREAKSRSEKISQTSADTIIDGIQSLLKQAHISEDSLELYHGYCQRMFELEILSMDEVKKPEKMNNKKDKKEYLEKLLEKVERLYVFDATREIALLSQIKAIQNDLEIMQSVFAEQKETLQEMTRIISTMESRSPGPNNKQPTNLEAKLDYRKAPNSSQDIIWNPDHLDHNLPLRTVLRYSERIEKMLKRAKIAEEALRSLVDLKQKQNNIIETRTARLQAEQSHRMMLQAEKQGKTLMVFTIVTIVFLPLSFITAFFAIPTREFDNGSLTLDFVSKITFPTSAAISILLIVIGFSASHWRLTRVTQRFLTKIQHRRGELPGDSGQSSDIVAV